MALWCRISKSKHLYSQFKSVPYGSLLNSTVSRTKPCVSDNPFLVFHDKPNGFGNSVRFFAAPVQFQGKQKQEKGTSGPRINEKITAEVIRLVVENEHVIVSRHEALNRARKLNLDLVEVQGDGVPPVCKIMDFHKEKYLKKLREKERAKIKSEATLRLGAVKEVRFSGKTEQKDLQMKADMVKRLMEQGYRVKCTARGSAGQELKETLSRLSSLSALIEDIAIVESGPHLGKDSAYVIVRHVKYGQSKKGGGKKYQALGDMSLGNEEVTSNSNPAVDSCGPIQDLSPAEPGSEAEDEILLDEVDQTITSSKAMPNENLRAKKTSWLADAGGNFDEVFNFNEDTKRVTSNSTAKPIIDFQQVASFQFGSDGTVRHPKQVLDSTKAHTKPSQPEVPDRTENRYKKNEAVNRFATTKGMDDRGLGTRDSVRLQPQFSNQGRQPPRDMNFSPLTRENKQVETNTSVFRNSKLPLNDSSKQEPSRPNSPTTPRPRMDDRGLGTRDSVRLQPQFSNQGRQPPRDMNFSPLTRENKQVETNASVFRNSKLPLNDSSKQEPSCPNSPTTSRPSYGIFSAHNANAPEKQGVAVEPARNSAR